MLELGVSDLLCFLIVFQRRTAAILNCFQISHGGCIQTGGIRVQGRSARSRFCRHFSKCVKSNSNWELDQWNAPCISRLHCVSSRIACADETICSYDGLVQETFDAWKTVQLMYYQNPLKTVMCCPTHLQLSSFDLRPGTLTEHMQSHCLSCLPLFQVHGY